MSNQSKNKFAKLEKLDFDKGWKSEQLFDDWLTTEQGLEALADALGLDSADFVDINRQVAVGPFKADIVLQASEQEHSKIVVENQRGATNHDHLGKMLTYASFLEARQVVWIAEEFKDEHREALDWLNRRTDNEIGFTGLEIELWRIGDSAPAPKFNLVCHVNQLLKESKTDLSDRQQIFLEYWYSFQEYLNKRNSKFAKFRAYATGEVSHRVGTSLCKFDTAIVDRGKTIRVQIYFNGTYVNGHKIVEFFKTEHGQELHAKLGQELEFIHSPKQKWLTGRIALSNGGIDIGNKDRWNEYHEWFSTTLDKFDAAFTHIINKIDPQEFPPLETSDS